MAQIGNFERLFKSSFFYLEKRRFLLTWPLWCAFLTVLLVNLFTAITLISHRSALQMFIFLTTSGLTASIFMVIGTLVWRYAYDRAVALPFFMAAFFAALVLSLQCSTSLPFFSVLTDIFSLLALICLSVVIFLFPVNTFHSSNQASSSLLWRIRGWYLAVLSLVGFLLTLARIAGWLEIAVKPDLSGLLLHIYLVCGLVGCYILAVIAYRDTSQLRAQQQLRFMFSGAFLSIVPFLIVTTIPQLLGLSGSQVVDPRISSMIFILLPLAFGYAVFRYQILHFDTKMLRVVGWFVGVPGLAVLAYLVIMLGNIFWVRPTLLSDLFEAIVLVWLSPIFWRVSQFATKRLLFYELLTYRERLQNPAYFVTDVSDRKAVAAPFVQAIEAVMGTSPTCLFLFDEEAGYYSLYPALDPADLQRQHLLEGVLQAVNPVMDSMIDFLSLYEPLIERIAIAPRPLFLSEACFVNNHDLLEQRFTWKKASYVKPFDPLLLPIRSAGKLIGLIIIGSRSERPFFAGVDLEVLDLIQQRFSSQFEMTLLYAQGNRHVDILNAMYITGTMPLFQTDQEVAAAYAKVAAEAVLAAAEIWLFDERTTSLRCLIHEGVGPYLPTNQPGLLEEVSAANWATFYYEGHTVISPVDALQRVPPCFPSAPGFPIAWIPLMRVQRPLGVLVLTYPRPHLFSHAERRIFELFANQCAAVLENTLITHELRAAYEQQKELDRLKDQFITTASHELRTPLTAIQGYIELLDEYNHQLTPEVRDEFIAKVHRGCDELSLMVGNIMDTSRIQEEVEQICIEPLLLREAVDHTAEILAPMLLHDHHDLQVILPDELMVMANDLHLRQILLNLIGNSLKYSPVGQKIEVYCKQDVETITVCVRDYGPGIPPEEQAWLFERFVRLDRDMNSPIRGAGLGLYISKFLIEAMGGKIWVESQGIPGMGSVFAFTLKPATVALTSQKKQEASPEIAQQRKA